MNYVLFPLVGAALGYGYHRLVGCRSGACLITARWWTATGYGVAMGLLFARQAALGG